jgi:hypothetical protein
LIFDELDNIWKALKAAYNGGLKKLVFGELPKDDDVRTTLKRIKEQLESVSWNGRVAENK